MPFTIGGDWLPSPKKKATQKKLIIVEQKKRGKWVTLLQNYSDDAKILKETAAFLKKQLHCGGTVKEGVIELQGAFKDQVLKALENK